jgi:hypothetical protein
MRNLPIFATWNIQTVNPAPNSRRFSCLLLRRKSKGFDDTEYEHVQGYYWRNEVDAAAQYITKWSRCKIRLLRPPHTFVHLLSPGCSNVSIVTSLTSKGTNFFKAPPNQIASCVLRLGLLVSILTNEIYPYTCIACLKIRFSKKFSKN